MYKVKFGGKKGKTIQLVESPDLVAIRTTGNKKLEDLSLTARSRNAMVGNKEIVAFPEAGVTVRQVADPNRDLGLESATGRTARRRSAAPRNPTA